MKKLTLTTICTLFAIAVLAQAPQGISHQAVIRNAANELVINSPIGIKVSILQGSAAGNVVYSETHTPISNANGLISFVIGQGTVLSGVIASIAWANGPYFIKTQADPTSGTNYTIEGITQMLSVPYAFNSASLTITSPDGNIYNVKVDNAGKIFANVFDCPPSIMDIDGNSYDVISIGSQCWMKENLKTTTYRNGAPIKNHTGNSDWQNNNIGAYAWFNNDISWKVSYGALYNWHAVNNANGLCPVGWHVPSDAEFTIMTNNCSGFQFAGGKLKSTRSAPDPHPRWESPNNGATNESNWSGLPGGNRHPNGGFSIIGISGWWWSSTESSTTNVWFRYLSYNDVFFERYESNFKTQGYSVRCLKD